MVGFGRAENVFGQVLICLRMSKLDYMIKETPYSAYVTIRNFFVKSIKEEMVELGRCNDKERLEDGNDIKKENAFLKDKIGDLEKDLATLKVENEEMEIKASIAEKDKLSLEDDIEDAYAESRNLRKTIAKKCDLIDSLQSEFNEKDKKINEVEQELSIAKRDNSNLKKQIKTTKDDLDKVVKDKNETINILEFTIESKVTEINILKYQKDVNIAIDDSEKASGEICENNNKEKLFLTEITDDCMPSTSKCGKCEYESDEECQMEVHVESNHVDMTNVNTCQNNDCKFDCDNCSYTAIMISELQKHKTICNLEKCFQCDFKAKSKAILKSHVIQNHGFVCDKCDHISNDEWKHNIHVCNITIHNPTFEDLYTKELIDQNGCNALYNVETNTDTIWLHCDKCWTNEIPCYYSPYLYINQPTKPGDKFHFEFTKFVEDGEICWLSLKEETNPFY